MVTAAEMRRRFASKKRNRFASGGPVLSDADVGIGSDQPSGAAPALASQSKPLNSGPVSGSALSDDDVGISARPASFDELSKLSEMKPHTSQGRAALEGALSGASANFRDEIYGASAASGLPEWLGGFRAPIGAARLGYEALTGEGSSATKAYEEGKGRIRGVQKAAQAEYPLTYGAGALGGALATVPLTGGTTAAATLPERMVQGAKLGAIYGGLSGVGEGEGLQDRLSLGATGAAIGAGLGAAAPPIMEGVSQLAGMASKNIGAAMSPVRAVQDPEGEAARRVATALQRDRAIKGGMSLTPEEAALAQSAGQDVRVADLGGETTRALARSAANTSPEAREIIQNVIEPRFEGQGYRVSDFVRSLVSTPANATKTREVFDELAQTARKPFYDAAYKAGSGGIWNDDLYRIANSTSMQPIMKEAALSLESKTAAGRAAHPLSDNGTPTLEFWDQVKRTLDSKINVANRAGDRETAGDLSAIRSKIVQAADAATTDPKTGVSAYETARGVSAEIFKASNAIEAGEKFLSSTLKNNEARKALMRMGPEERTLFAEGYASALSQKIGEVGDRRNIVNAIFQNPASRERIEIALGKDAAKRMEMFLHVENTMDGVRRAMGNSTTARQLAEMGLAGSGYGLATNDFSPTSLLTGALLWKGARMAGDKALNLANRKTAEKVAELLMSNDPSSLRKGIDMIGRNPRFQDALRRSGDYLTRLGVTEAPKPNILERLPALQGPVPTRADEEKQP